MKEITNIIEGYNTNGICVGCLNFKRKMFRCLAVKECFRVLANIHISDGLSIQVCWECMAAVRNVLSFREQISNSYDILKKYSNKNKFLISPQDLSCHATQKLTINSILTQDELKLKEGDNYYTKEEPDVNGYDAQNIFPDQLLEVKTEIQSEGESFTSELQNDKSFDNTVDSLPEDENTVYIKFEPIQEKKKRVKKQDSDIDHTFYKSVKKLKSFSPNLVELYTMTEDELRQVRIMDVASKAFQEFKYTCTLCVMSFNSKDLMEAHREGKHIQNGGCFQCDICKSNFLSKDIFDTHKKLHLKAFRCKGCGLTTTMRRIVSVHSCPSVSAAVANTSQRKPRQGRPDTCKDCGLSFETKYKLAYHRRTYHRDRPRCDCCDKEFFNKTALKYHLHPQSRPVRDKIDISVHCTICDKVFRSKKSYNMHVEIHKGVTHPCPTCGKLFQWRRNLARHMRRHEI